MSYDQFEVGRLGGRPVHLFRFTRQNLVWRYTTAARAIVVNGETFVPAQMVRSKIMESAQRVKNNVTIRLPYIRDTTAATYPVTQSLGANWHPFPPSQPVLVECMAMHLNDPDQQVVTEWVGKVTQPKFTDAELELTCSPGRPNGQFAGMALRCQRGCPLVLGSQGVGMCNVDMALHRVDAVLESVAGVLLQAEAFSATTRSLFGGYVEWVREDGVTERRDISGHDGDQITIAYGTQQLLPGMSVSAFPNCAHNWEACDSFDNTPNYGGHPYISNKNPFSPNPIW